ncbi:hypothetical protein [Thauera sinica]|uniref:DUF4149 domain-containing protein n=1 Tax=Thauera sinica TaxID=2665146 RepID=A0ABW1AY12_9RHOO|nr:hypothetical protein [Thauera sp. K11]ATE58656.1 hypothetical protein CCZ27_00590 [Thauera sp. K11]
MDDVLETVPLRRAQYGLALLWFVPAFFIFFVLMAQTLFSPVYEGHQRDVMEWYGALVWPTSTLIVGALVANAGMRTDRRVVDKVLLRIAQFCCGAYILALMITVFAPGLSHASGFEKDAWSLLTEARPWLLLLQGVITAMLGLFFSCSFYDEPPTAPAGTPDRGPGGAGS